MKCRSFLILIAFCAISGLMIAYTVKNSDGGSDVPKTAQTFVRPKTGQVFVQNVVERGSYFVLANFVKRKLGFEFQRSITFATASDYRFIDNLDHLVDRWRGPFSVTLHAPGDDFFTTMTAVSYLRKCKNPLIRDLVSFHIFFEKEHTPTELSWLNESLIDCDKSFLFYTSVPEEEMYKTKNKLLFPINVGRNIAKEEAETHFIFIADIELNPSPRNFIDIFLEFVDRRTDLFSNDSDRRQVFVLPIFEVPVDQKVPENKTELLKMYESGTAFSFHAKLCRECHEIPHFRRWISTEEEQNSLLDVLTVGKRTGKFFKWEPFYIGTRNEPFFEERLSWEGSNDKIIQNYIMCLLDYDYMILNNAFVVHNPGIKTVKINDVKYKKLVAKTDLFLEDVVKPEYRSLYGKREGC